ncbi:helix-turn-helix domain-containing protein [Paenibacillus daejeonensis]|uniref:helix-turn-helix domain-containing protein n=1 Tax=Paenibacillus daejeonensis TaxID=135193 RepID=UPI000373A303|nr:helix-turn-helix domain-containing protein [Paenibacillus daejeonensis]
MRMNWYYRMMLSYTPIFFIVISSVIFVLFSTLNHQSENRYIETNKAIVSQMMQNTEANLQLIERNAVSALITDRVLRDFFSDHPKEIYDYYTIQKKLLELKTTFPFVASIYLYNEDNHMVLADSNGYDLEAFADREFLMGALDTSTQSEWTGPREYTLSTIDRNRQMVVSLAKTYPFSTQQKGTIVINIYVSSMIEYLNQYNQENRGKVHILDANQQPFQPRDADLSNTPLRAVSSYTGWTYYVDRVNASGYSALSLLSNVWIILVLVIIVLALVWFTIITHVHYKPIQTLVEKVNTFAAKKSGALGLKGPNNEFKLIESAIDQLLKKSVDYDTLHAADTQHRKRILLQELLEGHRTVSDLQWKEQADQLGLPTTYARLGVVTIEIDRYAAFTEAYKPTDQRLLKYIVESAFREHAQNRGIALCNAWTKPHQMAFLLFLDESAETYAQTLFDLSEEYREWISNNLQLTVSVGIGAISDEMDAIALSYRNAEANVSYKAVFGTNTVIDNRMAAAKSGEEEYVTYNALPELAHLLRKGDGQWRERLADMIQRLHQRRIAKTDLTALVTGIIQHLEKDIATQSTELKSVWQEAYKEQFLTIMEEVETLEELHLELEAVLDKLAGEFERLRERCSNHSVAMQMKEKIDASYADPGLSLQSVSDEFGIPASHASVLFKKETGEKFIDYMLKVRLEHGRRMLLESDEPVQAIAEKVGYSHVLSFHRAFKKLFGFPPGEYRAIHRTQR